MSSEGGGLGTFIIIFFSLFILPNKDTIIRLPAVPKGTKHPTSSYIRWELDGSVFTFSGIPRVQNLGASSHTSDHLVVLKWGEKSETTEVTLFVLGQ